MTGVESFLKPDFEPCGCGCAVVARAKRPWKDGTACVKGCKCRRCIGANNKRKGGRKQARAVTALGVPRSTIHPGHEEFLGGLVRIEVKAGAQVRPAVTAFEKCERQSEASRAIGDNRPFVAVFMPDGSSDGLVTFRLSVMAEAVAALAEQLGMSA